MHLFSHSPLVEAKVIFFSLSLSLNVFKFERLAQVVHTARPCCATALHQRSAHRRDL